MLTETPQLSSAIDNLTSIDDIEQELMRLEGLVSQVRARQLELLREIDRLQVPYWDGTRSLKEWIAGRLDVHPRTASDLAVLAKAEPGPIRDALQAGVTPVDRAAGTSRLANTGADAATLEKADGIAVGQLGQLNARQRRVKTVDHHEAFRMRRVWFQPNLGNTLAIGSITMAGADCDMVLAGLDERADQIIDPADPNRPRLEQRRVDALVSLALDATTGQPNSTEGAPAVAPRRLKAHIFVDADKCSRTDGEDGATTRLGIKVGPSSLEEIPCIGETQTTLIDAAGLKAVATDGDRLPNRTRDFVFFRDGGCTSIYRLEPHHIRERGRGGNHDPDNLTLLCWFHHHLVVHQEGFRIDPYSPPGKRRFIPPGVTRAPPDG